MNDSGSTQAPAGWYTDPESPGDERWWDGAAWAAPSSGRGGPDDMVRDASPSSPGTGTDFGSVPVPEPRYDVWSGAGDPPTTDGATLPSERPPPPRVEPPGDVEPVGGRPPVAAHPPPVDQDSPGPSSVRHSSTASSNTRKGEILVGVTLFIAFLALLGATVWFFS